MSAFLYLAWTSGRNRIGRSLQRVRSPRYAAALVAGALYVWSFLLRPAGRPSATSMLLGQPTEMMVTLLVAAMLMGTWMFGADATALAFSPAEVSMLFPAPLSRRALIGYKLFRAQIAVVISALIWVFVLRRGGTMLPSPLRAIGLWVLFSTLNLHRLGVALVRSSWREHGRSGVRRHRGSIIVAGAVAALLIAGVWRTRASLLAAPGFDAFFTALGRGLASPPAAWALYPWHLIVAPAFARSAVGWSRAIAPAFAVMLVHAWWVLRTDTAFEEAAIDASVERARRAQSLRLGRSVATTAAPRGSPTLRLSPRGHPAMAILWKNMLCLRRTARPQVLIGPLVMAIAIGAATASRDSDAGLVVATCAMAFAAMLVLFGGRLIRNDLRHDMQHLPLLKSLPVPPSQIVLAEVASAALPMAALQMALVLVAYVAVLGSPSDPLGREGRLAMLIAAPFVVASVSGALLTIQNGTAVLFPAWIRLGPTVTTGVEALGQNLLATAANLVSLAIALIVPGLLAWGAARALGEPGPLTLALVVIVAAVLLSAETYAAIGLLGGALGRAEPLQTE